MRNLTENKRKAIVLKVAKGMCANDNRLSTKRLKIELRNQYPKVEWNQYDNGQGVSDLFHELVQEGHFRSIADNGTYQTYADVTLPIRSRKGDSFIPDNEETLLTATHAVTANLGTALKTASKNARTKKAVKGTTKVTPTGNRKTTISRTKALQLMQNNKGRFFTAVFTKKNGDERTMNCQYKSVTNLGYVLVKDMVKKQERNLNLQTLSQLRIGGVNYKVK